MVQRGVPVEFPPPIRFAKDMITFFDSIGHDVRGMSGNDMIGRVKDFHRVICSVMHMDRNEPTGSPLLDSLMERIKQWETKGGFESETKTR